MSCFSELNIKRQKFYISMWNIRAEWFVPVVVYICMDCDAYIIMSIFRRTFGRFYSNTSNSNVACS